MEEENGGSLRKFIISKIISTKHVEKDNNSSYLAEHIN